MKKKLNKSAKFILDLHFGKKCNIRLDDTDTTIYEKLEKVFDDCVRDGTNIVVLAGDIFDNCSISRKTFMTAIKIFNQFKTCDIDVYTIFGNHDEYRYNKTFRSETPLNDLMKLGLIKDLQDIELIFGDKVQYKITGFEYLDDGINDFIKNNKDTTFKNICIGHTFYDNEFMGGKKNINKELLENSNIDYLILGHDHSWYDPITVGKTTVYRFGSLVRGTSSVNDLNRKVGYLHIDDNGPRFVEIPTKELKDITIAKATIKEEKQDFKEMIEELTVTETEEIDTVMDYINKLENETIKEIIRRHI